LKDTMKRKCVLFASDISAILLLFVLSGPALGQTPAQQPTPAKKADDDDLINPDRPGIADGSTVIGGKKIQIEGGVQLEFRRQDNTTEHTQFVPLLLRIGISKNWEARIEGNSFDHESDRDAAGMTQRSSGLAPFSVGIKYHITDSEGVTHPSLGTIVRIFPAWGEGGFRSHHVQGDWRIAADWDFAPKLKLSLNPNIGVGVYEDNKGKVYTAGLLACTLGYQPTKKLNPFIDFAMTAPEEKAGRTAVIVDGGVAYVVGSNVELDASLGTGTHGNTPPHPFLLFGVSFRANAPWRRK